MIGFSKDFDKALKWMFWLAVIGFGSILGWFFVGLFWLYQHVSFGWTS
jgi:hypothetical protein